MPSLWNKTLSGVHVKHSKNTAASEAHKIPTPDVVVLPMIQHMGAPCQPLVKVGDLVTIGQKIGDTDAFMSSPIHASVSGKVTELREFVTAGGAKCLAVVIETDKEQTVCPDLKAPTVTNLQELIAAVRACGLVGLGGAGFPTHIKLNPKNLSEVDTLVVNGAECEPYITCDMRLMLESTDKLLAGIAVVQKHLNLANVVIGVEDNKPEVITKLTAAVASLAGVSVKTLKALYPKGAEKVLVYECTGRIIKEGTLPADAGVVVCNVATLAKLQDYLETGMPLVEKMITVDGSAVASPQNVLAPIGTSMADIIAFCGGYKAEAKKLLMGGPMMGTTVPSDDFPLLKNNNAILAFVEKDAEMAPETPCIRCGKCMWACPFGLAPAKLDKAYRNGDVAALKALKVNLCMECGCCAYVCPAKRDLVMSNKLGKQLIREQKN